MHLTRTRFSSPRIHMHSRPHADLWVGARVGATTTYRWGRTKPSDPSPRSARRNRAFWFSTLRSTRSLALPGRWWAKPCGALLLGFNVYLVLMFFEAIIEARAMMERREAIGSAAGAAFNEKRHDENRPPGVIAVVASHKPHARPSHHRSAGAGNPHFLLLKPTLPSKWRRHEDAITSCG
jgi:hypothetical protein